MSIALRTLGKSGIEVTELCFGTLILGHLQADMTPEEGAKAVRHAWDRGITFFDTAKFYRTYAHLKEGLAGIRDAVIASKSHAVTASDMRADVEDCLKETGREVIDIFHLHLVTSAEDLKRREDALAELVRCRTDGLIRSIGLTAHGPDGVRAASAYPEIEVVMPLLNRTGLGITDRRHDDMVDATREAYESNLGVYDMKPLGGGHLIYDIPGSIQYLKDLGIFHSISAGLKTPEEVDIMAGVFENDEATIMRAYKAGMERGGKKRLHIYDMCKRCGNCIDSCAQGALSMGEKKAVVDPELCVLCGYCATSCPHFMIRVI